MFLVAHEEVSWVITVLVITWQELASPAEVCTGLADLLGAQASHEFWQLAKNVREPTLQTCSERNGKRAKPGYLTHFFLGFTTKFSRFC